MYDLLIVEDDSFLNKVYNSKFKKEKIKFAIVTDGERALNWLSENETHFIILDLVMPNMNGIQFLKKKDKDMRIKDVRVAIVSNLSDQKMYNDVSKFSGVKSVITKSNHSAQEIVDTVKRFLCQTKNTITT